VLHARSHQPAHSAVIVLLATSAWLSCIAVADADPRASVVRVYDTGNGSSAGRTAAIRTASAILNEAGVPIEWRDCTRSGSQPDCQHPRRGDLIVRIMPTAKPGTVSSGSSLLLRTRRGEEHLQLGIAVLNPVTLAGQMATVFQEPVQRIASRSGVDPAELLGRTMAHEIGHLLLRTKSHSATGLMREVWSLEELTSNRGDDWRFAPGDRRQLQQQKWGRESFFEDTPGHGAMAQAFRPARQDAERGSVLEK